MKKQILIIVLAITILSFIAFVGFSVANATSDLVTICHKDGDEWHTISVDKNAVKAHLDHGDYLGACVSSSSSSSLHSESSSKSSESEESSESSSEKSSSSSSKTSESESSGTVSSRESSEESESSESSRTFTVLGFGTGDLAQGE